MARRETTGGTRSATARLALFCASAVVIAGCTLSVESESSTDSGVVDDPSGSAAADQGQDTIDGSADETADGTAADGGGDRAAIEPPSGAEPITIDRVIDGDSLEVFLADGSPAELRLEGINAPELNALAGGRTCAGDAALAELSALLAAGEVTLTGDEFDRFDRLLARLYVEGHAADLDLIRAGWALALWSAEDPTATSAMIEAAEAGRGWWGDGCGPPVSDGMAIGDTQANAPGDDRENLDEEWVELVNDGDAEIDLDGWVLRDDTTSNRFLLPAITLTPGETLRVITGSGGGSDALALGEDFPVWSNNGETVLLIDPEGVIAAWAFIS